VNDELALGVASQVVPSIEIDEFELPQQDEKNEYGCSLDWSLSIGRNYDELPLSTKASLCS
jgi:hypothetical protein